MIDPLIFRVADSVSHQPSGPGGVLEPDDVRKTRR